MSDLLTIKRTTAEGVAAAIRRKTGKTALLTSEEWEAEIDSVSGSDPLAEFDQQNALVSQYLSASAGYSAEDYSTTVMTLDYMYAEPGYVKWHPTGHTITVKAGGELHLTDGDKTLVKTVTAGEQVLVNCAPGKIAHWWLTVDGTVMQSGTVKPSGKVRMIATTAINVRDLGGWDCDGGTVKYGKLYRGALLTEADRDALVGQLGIRRDLDLRGTNDNDGITESPLGSEVHYTATNGYPWYTLTYRGWADILRTIFNAVAHDEPLIFHCRQGADRTGTVACIVEALLGMDQTDCDRDYELTTLAGTEESPCQRIRTTADKWVTLIEEINALTVGETFRDRVVNWVGSLGFKADDINAFRRAMIDGEPEDIIIESAEESVYQRVEWVRIIDNAGSAEHAKHCIHSYVKWNECNKIVCKVACEASSHDLDIIFSAWTGTSGATSPYIATRNEESKFTCASGLTSYAVTPNNEPVASTEPQEYTMTFTSTSTNDMRLGGWIDTQYSHPHKWYYIRLYHDDTLLAEYLPSYRKADGVIGFEETVSGDFCLNGYNDQGFSTKGNDI